MKYSHRYSMPVLLAVFMGLAIMIGGVLPAMAQESASAQGMLQNNSTQSESESASESEEGPLVFESLRGLPYLTIEDTLRHQRELNGLAKPFKPDTSLLFSSWEHALLREMKLQNAVARPTQPGEAENSGDPNKPRPKGIRELSLGGIVYIKADDWTVWLNGKRVTPDAIPEQVLDMHVKNDYIEIKWFDSYTNLVYPLRLRPHQRFNLDNRIFLPGTAPGAL